MRSLNSRRASTGSWRSAAGSPRPGRRSTAASAPASTSRWSSTRSSATGVPPTPAPAASASGMIGPTLIIHGTKEQKKHYLPRITSGEDIWCQGYSEPGAGSDLASLQTRAHRDGDDFVINGQKIWTSGGHRANQMFCLVRTDPEAPKHRGISFLLIDDIKNVPGPHHPAAHQHGQPAPLQRSLLRRRPRPGPQPASAKRTAAGTSA